MNELFWIDKSPFDPVLERYLDASWDIPSRARHCRLARSLKATANTCTKQNVKWCKNVFINQILPYRASAIATFEFLRGLSAKFEPRPSELDITNALSRHFRKAPQPEEEPLPAYQRLHIVYAVQDVLETLLQMDRTRRIPNHLKTVDLDYLIHMVKSEVMCLFKMAACRGEAQGDEVGPKLLRLLGHWKGGVFTAKEIDDLENVVKSIRERSWDMVLAEHSLEDNKRAEERKRHLEEVAKWTIPYRHCVKDDFDAPWHELPAANGLYMKSTRGYPLRAAAFPRAGYQVKNGDQDADRDLRKDVTWLHKEMLRCFEGHTNHKEVKDIDPLGNKVWKDPERPTRNYWGFTYDGIEKARENSKKFRENARGYDDIAPLRQERTDDVDSAVARARALAGGGHGGYGGYGGYDGRGGPRGKTRGRGGWRGPPRGGGGSGGGYLATRGEGYYLPPA